MLFLKLIERAASNDQTKYALGSVLNHVKLHQTIVGQEAIKQMEKAGNLPDIVIAPFGGGSNFAGLSFPFYALISMKEKKLDVLQVNQHLVQNLLEENSDMILEILVV